MDTCMIQTTPSSWWVGVGASAGGIEALQQFFALVPADSGCAYTERAGVRSVQPRMP